MKIAVVENEDKEREIIVSALQRYEKELGGSEKIEISEFTDGMMLVTNYTGSYDLILMDIEMNLMNGIDAAYEIRKTDMDVCIIFITNLAQYAIQGYKVDALDYFIKPISYYDLKMRLDRVRALIKGKGETVVIRIAGGIKNIELNDIVYIESQNHDMIYHTRSGTYTTRYKSMKEIAGEMKDKGFARCNVCYLVNLKHCVELQHKVVTMDDGSVLKCSRNMYKEFKEKLEESMGI